MGGYSTGVPERKSVRYERTCPASHTGNPLQRKAAGAGDNGPAKPHFPSRKRFRRQDLTHLMKSSIELAQAADLLPISTIRDRLDLHEDEVDAYGKYIGKINLSVLDRLRDAPDGKLILVTAVSPTRYGEGKTLTTVGLGQALGQLGKRGIIALREPSLGPVFGIKGGAAGGGLSQVLPMEQINLHFTGDIHALTTAHNLLAAMLDNHILKGNVMKGDVTRPMWGRALDMNDRALRHVVVGLGGHAHGVPRESGFVITAASEVMAILALAQSRADLKARLGNIVVGYTEQQEAVTARDVAADRAMAAVLNEAIKPNLVQTMEGTPALIHAGPFANIAHGTSSVLATRIARKLADYVVTEAGFGADLGAEKFFNIVCRQAGFWPSAVVLVATCRAMKLHGGVPDKPLERLMEENMPAFEAGLENLKRHIANVKKFGAPIIVAINRFPWDTEAELTRMQEVCAAMGVPCVSHEAFAKGGAGALALAAEVTQAADYNTDVTPRYLYPLEASVEDKVATIAREIYGAAGVHFEKQAVRQMRLFEKLGYGDLPICIAKTQSSFSDDASVLGAPTGWTLTVTDVRLSAGAGFLVVVCGNMMLMPGLPSVPAAVNIDVDEDGQISGLF